MENLVTLTCFDSEYGGSMQYVKNDVQIGEEEVNWDEKTVLGSYIEYWIIFFRQSSFSKIMDSMQLRPLTDDTPTSFSGENSSCLYLAKLLRSCNLASLTIIFIDIIVIREAKGGTT